VLNFSNKKEQFVELILLFVTLKLLIFAYPISTIYSDQSVLSQQPVSFNIRCFPETMTHKDTHNF